eukprot:1550865-Rhodomonas_salina.2
MLLCIHYVMPGTGVALVAILKPGTDMVHCYQARILREENWERAAKGAKVSFPMRCPVLTYCMALRYIPTRYLVLTYSLPSTVHGTGRLYNILSSFAILRTEILHGTTRSSYAMPGTDILGTTRCGRFRRCG